MHIVWPGPCTYAEFGIHRHDILVCRKSVCKGRARAAEHAVVGKCRALLSTCAASISTCSLPQSYCSSRRSGKNSCWRTMAGLRGPAPWNHACSAVSACCSAASTADKSGRLHQIAGDLARTCNPKSITSRGILGRSDNKCPHFARARAEKRGTQASRHNLQRLINTSAALPQC